MICDILDTVKMGCVLRVPSQSSLWLLSVHARHVCGKDPIVFFTYLKVLLSSHVNTQHCAAYDLLHFDVPSCLCFSAMLSAQTGISYYRQCSMSTTYMKRYSAQRVSIILFLRSKCGAGIAGRLVFFHAHEVHIIHA